MKISVCITTFNESEERVKKLLDALSKQTLKPDEIIIVEATRISNLKFLISNQFSKLNLQIINKPNTSRAEGRNISIGKARNEIIAITDVGCVPHNDWLEKITLQLRSGQVKPDVVSGGYKMVAKNNFEKAEAVFLGVSKKNIDSDFLPSARSMAFTKSIWKKVGGFPESLSDTAEDTVFNLNLHNVGAKFAVAKNAVVDWYMPENIFLFMKKVKNYAKGDAQSGIWWHPVKKWQTHNIKVVTIFLRYILGAVLFFVNHFLFFVYVTSYTVYAYRKAGLWGICLQFISDFACMSGFLSGLMRVESTSG